MCVALQLHFSILRKVVGVGGTQTWAARAQTLCWSGHTGSGSLTNIHRTRSVALQSVNRLQLPVCIVASGLERRERGAATTVVHYTLFVRR
jgi:hypothetical protein